MAVLAGGGMARLARVLTAAHSGDLWRGRMRLHRRSMGDVQGRAECKQQA
jgi:hypothetical protein